MRGWTIRLLHDKIKEADCGKKRTKLTNIIQCIEGREVEGKKPESVLTSTYHGK